MGMCLKGSSTEILPSKHFVGKMGGKHLSRWGRVILPLTDPIHYSCRLCSLITVRGLEGLPRVCIIAITICQYDRCECMRFLATMLEENPNIAVNCLCRPQLC